MKPESSRTTTWRARIVFDEASAVWQVEIRGQASDDQTSEPHVQTHPFLSLELAEQALETLGFAEITPEDCADEWSWQDQRETISGASPCIDDWPLLESSASGAVHSREETNPSTDEKTTNLVDFPEASPVRGTPSK